MRDSYFVATGKTVAYIMGLVFGLIVVFRFGVGGLIGSRSDLGMVAAPLVGGLGIIGLAYVARLAYRDIKRTIRNGDHE